MVKKKIKSTIEELLDGMTVQEREEYEREREEFILSELLLAVMAEDDISVRQLAKMAGVSPTVVQAMRSGTKKDFSMKSFFKILKGLGCKKLMVEMNGQLISLDIDASIKK